jgi:hypothetical protein
MGLHGLLQGYVYPYLLHIYFIWEDEVGVVFI